MEHDDLETTMRHGLRELANDAPRGEGLWETTTSMIAIQPEQQASPDEDLPQEDLVVRNEAPAPPPRTGLGLGIVLGLAIAALLGAAILAVVMLRDSGTKSGGAPVIPKNPSTVAPPKSVPSPDASWRAVRLSRDRAQLFVAKLSGLDTCTTVWDLDLLTRVIPTSSAVYVVAQTPGTDHQYRLYRVDPATRGLVAVGPASDLLIVDAA